jgi:hypothetical protein
MPFKLSITTYYIVTILQLENTSFSVSTIS